MSSPAPTLDELRREIDRIDAAMHDLLMQRTAVVEEVGRAKARETPAGPDTRPQFFRPGREALVLRSLVARHRTSFPVASLVRIWREIMTGQLRVQTEITVAVYTAAGKGGSYWDMARDHYGAGAIYIPCKSTAEVLAAVRSGAAGIGVLPVPSETDEEPWWPLLAVDEDDAPAIVARIPFLSEPNQPDGALLVARVDPESTGADRSYLSLSCPDPAKAAEMVMVLRDVGLSARPVALGWDPAAKTVFHLFEAAEMVLRDDARLREIERNGIRAQSLGGYALPIGAAVPCQPR